MIIKIKFKFIKFIDNVIITIKNTIIKTRFYIIKSLKIKVVFKFLFI